MNRTKVLKRVLLSSLLAAACVTGARAQYAEDVLRFSQSGLGVGAKALGMGTATVGWIDDYSALFWNPAGLATIRDFEFSAGLGMSSYGDKATFFGTNTSADMRFTNLNNLGIVYPIPTSRGSLTFAFGYGRTADYSSIVSFNGFNPSSSIVRSLAPDTDLLTMSQSDALNYINNNIPFLIYLADTSNDYFYPIVTDSVQQSGTVTEGGGMNTWSLGGAIDIAKDFSLGVSLNILTGSYSYDREYTESDSRNVYHASYVFPWNFDTFTYTSTIRSDLSGFNALFGFMYRKQGRFRIGATVKTPTTYEISETFSDQGTSRFDDGSSYSSGAFSGKTTYRIKTPVVMAVGASVQIVDWLMLAGDAEYTDWTQMQFDSDNPDLVAENRTIQTIYKPTTNLRAGAEVTLWGLGLKLRGGYVLNPSPYKGDPSSFDQKYYTAGAGFIVDENITLNAGYAYGTWKTFRDNYYLGGAVASRTSESVTTHRFNFTLSYRF